MSQKWLQQELENELKGRGALKCENTNVQELNYQGLKPSYLCTMRTSNNPP